jgi:murein DD-endopeptidase MepM/ murein hydrolase activator NlpD
VWLTLGVLVLMAGPGAAALPDRPWPYVWPVDVPIVDDFRPPASPYGPGNRGLEFSTNPGTPVRAARAGTILFAGQVGGRLFVTLGHVDGVRTSYSFLASIFVRRGDWVLTGQYVGLSGPVLHVGARVGMAYVDPAILFGANTGARLIPVVGEGFWPL